MAESEVSRAISKLKSPDGFLYAGLPKFKALFGRDSIISALGLLSFDPQIAESTLEALTRYQGVRSDPETLEEPGKIIHEYQHNKELIAKRLVEVPWIAQGKNYFSVDSTPLFVILANELQTGYNPVNEAILEACSKALKWIVNQGICDTFLSYMKAAKGKGLQSQSWRDGIGDVLEKLKDPVSTIGIQGYAYQALTGGVQLLKDRTFSEDSDLFSEFTETAVSIREKLDDFFFIEDTGFYALAVDGDGVSEKTVSSDPGHLIWSGILNRNRERLVIDRLMEDDMLTEFGIRSLSSKSEYFDEKAYQRGSVWPHDNLLITMGLTSRGYASEAKEISARVIAGLEKLGGFPEYFGVRKNGEIIAGDRMRIQACDPQAWSVSASYFFSNLT